MATRYSRIRQAAQLQQALTNYTRYLTTPRVPQVNSRGAQDPKINAYVTPFGYDLLTTQVVRVRVGDTAYPLLAPRINASGTGGKISNTLGSNTVVTRGGFAPARIVWFRNATRSVEEKRSDVTNTPYLKYNGERSSCAFGRAAADDNMNDAFEAIKAGIFAANAGLAVNRVTLTPEKVRYGQ
jgi:hypothetical protein